MTSPFSKLSDEQLLGLTIDREARGESYAGRVAIGSVVLNRVDWGQAHKRWGALYGNSIQSVILALEQFSWTIDDPLDLNHAGAVEIATDFDAALKKPEYQWLESNLEIAQGLILKTIKRNVSALYYHEVDAHPAWAKGGTPSQIIGKHYFYNSV